MRTDGRANDALRPLSFETGFNVHAEGSCIVSTGRTRVHCTATVETDVPRWRLESQEGWVTAEYRMLPRSTHTRVKRSGFPPGGRESEIQRLIGRALRAGVDLKALGPVQITVDCDVLQADGGTRTAAINGGYVALALACQKLVDSGRIPRLPLIHGVSAVSVGIVRGTPMLDLAYDEDAGAEVDLNVVMTGGGDFVEVQGCAEGKPFPRAELDRLLALGDAGLRQISAAQARALPGLHLGFPMGSR